jgi:hypothetical protein
MKKSRFFAELSNTYSTEIDDLLSDSEGKNVLQSRLKQKRQAFDAILPMIEFAPEMVAVVFYDAFTFKDTSVIQKAVLNEPDRSGFPAWRTLKGTLGIAEWAKPLIGATLNEEGGETFLVITATLEFIRLRDSGDVAPPQEDETKEKTRFDDEEDDDDRDLSEAGADWMASQGFDSTEQ